MTVAVSSEAFLTNKITFRQRAGSFTTLATQAADLDDFTSSSSTNTREIELIADSEPAKNPAKKTGKK